METQEWCREHRLANFMLLMVSLFIGVLIDHFVWHPTNYLLNLFYGVGMTLLLNYALALAAVRVTSSRGMERS